MKVGGLLELSIGEIQQTIKAVRDYKHKDKEAMCLNIDIINSSLHDWYNDIIAKYSPWLANDMKVDSSELTVIYECAKNATRREITEESLAYFQNVEKLYSNDKLNNDLQDKLDINKIRQAKESLQIFMDKTIYEKNAWMDAAFYKRQFDSQHVIDWHDDLDRLRKIINESLSSVKHDLKCKSISRNELRNYGLLKE